MEMQKKNKNIANL